MAGIILPVSLTSEQANLIMELIKRRITIIENMRKDVGVVSNETEKVRDDLRDLGNWIWDHFGSEIEEKNLL
jgi:archaellum component FlaC